MSPNVESSEELSPTGIIAQTIPSATCIDDARPLPTGEPHSDLFSAMCSAENGKLDSAANGLDFENFDFLPQPAFDVHVAEEFVKCEQRSGTPNVRSNILQHCPIVPTSVGTMPKCLDELLCQTDNGICCSPRNLESLSPSSEGLLSDCGVLTDLSLPVPSLSPPTRPRGGVDEALRSTSDGPSSQRETQSEYAATCSHQTGLYPQRSSHQQEQLLCSLIPASVNGSLLDTRNDRLVNSSLVSQIPDNHFKFPAHPEVGHVSHISVHHCSAPSLSWSAGATQESSAASGISNGQGLECLRAEHHLNTQPPPPYPFHTAPLHNLLSSDLNIDEGRYDIPFPKLDGPQLTTLSDSRFQERQPMLPYRTFRGQHERYSPYSYRANCTGGVHQVANHREVINSRLRNRSKAVRMGLEELRDIVPISQDEAHLTTGQLLRRAAFYVKFLTETLEASGENEK
eukprot:scpid65018/ scgid11446/ 